MRHSNQQGRPFFTCYPSLFIITTNSIQYYNISPPNHISSAKSFSLIGRFGEAGRDVHRSPVTYFGLQMVYGGQRDEIRLHFIMDDLAGQPLSFLLYDYRIWNSEFCPKTEIRGHMFRKPFGIPQSDIHKKGMNAPISESSWETE